MSEKPNMTALIHRYLTSQASAEERQSVDAWLLESNENREMFEEIKLIWDHSEEEPVEISDEELQQGLHNLEKTIAEKIREEQQQATDQHGFGRYQRGMYKNLAIIVLLIISSLSVWAFYAQYNLSAKEIVISGKREILLPDSTEIFLNKATTVFFRQNLWRRETNLEGEAFFEVYRNERRSFFIHIGETTIKVLGTSFLVKAYPGEPVQVSVISGNVAVLHKDQNVLIHTGEQVLVTANHEFRKSDSFNPNQLAWKTGKLVFKNTQVQEVLRELGKMYDVHFQIEDKEILQCHFTGQFDNLALKEALDILSFSLHMSVDFVNNKIIQLSGQGKCQ